MYREKQRRLVIKSFHIDQLRLGEPVGFQAGSLTLPERCDFEHPLIESHSIRIIQPGQHDVEINTIMDILPISKKVLGRLGEGITHTFTGAYVMLTGADASGRQMNNFGSSEGILKEQLVLNRCGTPSDTDFILHIDVTLKADQVFERNLTNSAFALADHYIAKAREILRKLDGRDADEIHEFYDRVEPEKTRVVLIKQVAGQGAMYDNMVLAKEPSGFDGLSVIDMANMPILLSPNEYRDGAIRALV